MNSETKPPGMTGADIAFLAIRFGPLAFELIDELAAVWNKEMTPEELKAFCLKYRKSEEQYVEQERARRTA